MILNLGEVSVRCIAINYFSGLDQDTFLNQDWAESEQGVVDRYGDLWTKELGSLRFPVDASDAERWCFYCNEILPLTIKMSLETIL